MSSLIFPTIPGLAPKSTRAPIDTTTVQTTRSGRELRALRTDRMRWRYRLSFQLRSASAWNELQSLESFIQRHAGRYDSFLWMDPEDSSVTTHGFGIGTGSATAFQLQRTRGGSWQDLLGTWDTYVGPRTNALKQSTTFSTWSLGGGVTLTQAVSIAPDGTVTGVRLNLASSGGGVYIHSPTFTGTAAVWTGSVYLRADVGNSADLGFYDGSTFATVTACSVQSGPGTASIVGGMGRIVGLSATAWTRVTFASTLTTAATWRFTVYPGAFGSATAGQHIQAWQAQAELGATATRPIATTTVGVAEWPTYWPNPAGGYEPVAEPDWDSVTITNDGVTSAPGSGWTPGTSGVVNFVSAPASSAELRWSGNFYKRVRLDTEEYDFDRIVSLLWELGSLDLITVI